jgi:hypothetical protein
MGIVPAPLPRSDRKADAEPVWAVKERLRRHIRSLLKRLKEAKK